jgi:phage portal protein BeeE
MGLIETVRDLFNPVGARRREAENQRALSLTLNEWASYFSYGGHAYAIQQTLAGPPTEGSDGSYRSLVAGAYKSNGVIFACMLARQLLFSEARFQFRQMRNGRPGDLFGTPELSVLERPWPGGTTGDLLSRAIQDADLAGNFFAVRRPNRIRRLRPDWVTIVLGSTDNPEQDAAAIDAEVIGYVYWPGGRHSGAEPVTLLRDEVAHFAPTPDPVAPYRGMSWLTPVINEITADTAMTVHKLKFFENGATANMVVTLDPAIREPEFLRWVEKFKAGHEGVLNAYKTIYLGGGADVKVVGSDLKQVDFKVTQGAGETRIAAAAGVPPIIVGLSEGLDSATYSNYGQARRRFADGTMRPLWRNMASSLEMLVTPPAGSTLWYDDRDIPFLAEDLKDRAEIQRVQAAAIKSLIDAGFDAASVVSAVTADDLERLKHTGLFSVQLQPPGSKLDDDEPPLEPPVPPERGLLIDLLGR